VGAGQRLQPLDAAVETGGQPDRRGSGAGPESGLLGVEQLLIQEPADEAGKCDRWPGSSCERSRGGTARGSTCQASYAARSGLTRAGVTVYYVRAFSSSEELSIK
jgi:hypothetical protein